ncbi:MULTISPECIES: flagellar hook-associated protein FlgK [unclassified Iodidimonas]|jgi:flagellar hook-associated protein 1 FlgK|uniref:flagellar hook-associated protein FlgK n=1 Tax=unclassified Iodidimonas TaxID=2626145 RepID=UPI002482BC60|nr:MULTISPECIES: flagellar hook-associated protein FlgK [unclassified Iodidimonas]
MSLTLALSNAQSGLRAAQQQIATTSVNIANASTEGFVRKDVSLSSLVLGGVGSGVVSSQLRSPVDQQLVRDIRFQSALTAGAEVQAEALGRYSFQLGEPGEERSIPFLIEGLADGFRALFDAPASPSAQRGALNAANALVDGFGALQDTLNAERLTAEQSISFAVSEANERLGRIEDLNRDIRQAVALGEDASDLQDERDRQLDGLSSLMGIRSFTREDGEMVVLSREGVTLVDGRARQIDFTAVSAMPPNLVFGAGLSGLSVEGIEITPGGGDPTSIQSGRLAGLFALRDEVFPAFQAQLDGLASGVINSFQNADPSVPAGTPALFTDAGGAHDPAAFAVGLAGRIAVNSAQVDPAQGGVLSRLRDGVGAIVPGASGDSSQIANFLDGLTGTTSFPPGTGLPTSQTLLGFAAAMVDQQQTQRVAKERDAGSSAIVRDTLMNRLVNQTGVNVDDEAQRLLIIEQAFSANARIIATVQAMFDELNRIR